VSEATAARCADRRRPQTASCERRAELVKLKYPLSKLGTLGDGFQAVEKIELRPTAARREEKLADLVRLRFVGLERVCELCGDGIVRSL